MRDIEGKVAVVTGGANGIGLAMGRHFAEHGMRVMLADIQPGPLDEAVAGAPGRRPRGRRAASPTSPSPSRSSTSPRRPSTSYGAVHVLCNNAGIGPGGQTQLWEYEPNDWRWCLDVNVLGIAWGIKAFVPRMLAQGTEGHIVNTSSGNGGIAPMGDAAIYAMTKSAVTTLTELLYYQLKSQGTQLSCSVLFPGPNWLRTQLWDAWKTRPPEYAKSVERTTPYPSFEEFEAAHGGGRDAAADHAARRGRGARARRGPRRPVLDQPGRRRPARRALRRDEGAPQPRLLPQLERAAADE